MVVPIATPVVLGRYELPGNLASIAALAASGQVAILPHELIRTTDGRVYHWTGTALEITSAPVHHGTVADVAALDGIYMLPSCTRGVHSGDTAYVTAAGCEYRVTAGVNATATWAACADPADPAGTADAAVSTHNTAPDAHADIRTLIGGKQAAGDYLLASGTAADSAKLGGVAASGYSQTSHTHNYAGSTTPGGAATTALECTGNSATANAAKYPRFSDDAMDPVGMDISQRISSGIYQGNPDIGATTAKGWPMNGEWTHLIAATHNNKGNNYSMQIAGLFSSQRFFARNTNNNGATHWVEFVTSGNAGSTIPDGALAIGKTDGLQSALNVRPLAYPVIAFGGDSNTWTTSEFVSFCQQNGLFGAPYVSVRGTWQYASNRIISDTGCGDIHLAGALVEVFVGTIYEYLIRVTTAPSGPGTTATKAVFVYQNHGAGYSPGWIRIASAQAAGFTGAKVIGGTTLNFVNGLLVS